MPHAMRFMLVAAIALCALPLPAQAQRYHRHRYQDAESAADAQKVDKDAAAGASVALNYNGKLPSPEKTAAELKAILARKEFQSAVRPPQPTLLERILRWLAQHFNVRGLGIAGSTAMYLTAAVGAVLLVLLIYALVRALWSRFTSAGKPEEAEREEDLTTSGWLKLAEAAAARGDFRAAVRYLFKAVVAQLNLPAATVTTNWQLMKQVRREHPAASADFSALVMLFEDCWYGGQEAGAADYSRASELAKGVESALTPLAEAA